jgi:dTDP-glucose 4,6-dehydratase
MAGITAHDSMGFDRLRTSAYWPMPKSGNEWHDKRERVSMNILVTGGAGFIGSNFLNLFVRRWTGHTFINVDALTYAANLRNLSPIAAAPNYRFEHVDIADLDSVMSLFETYHPQLVVHFAAESHVDRSIRGPRAFLRANVEGTLNLLEACRAYWVQGQGLFHHVSTDEVYGSLGSTGRFTEATRYDPSSPYSASKAASDHLVRAYVRTFGLNAKISTCSNNYGPLQFPEKLIPLMILNLLERKPLPVYGRGQNVRDWLYVSDHCEAIWAVIERGKLGETYNIGGHNEQRNIDVIRLLIRIVAEDTGASEKELLDLITYVTDRPGHDLRYAIDARKIKRELGWTPRETFESGIRKTVRWYLENKEWCDAVRSGQYRAWIDQNYGARSCSKEPVAAQDVTQ